MSRFSNFCVELLAEAMQSGAPLFDGDDVFVVTERDGVPLIARGGAVEGEDDRVARAHHAASGVAGCC
jgi:hypothetical protein